MPSVDCYTDRRLVRCKVAFTFKSPPKRKGPQTKKLQVHKLRDPRVKNNLQVMLEERLHCVTSAEPEEQWKQMKTILQETTADVVGCRPKNTETGLTKQIRTSKSCSKRNAPATIICLQKPDDQAAKAAYKITCSTLQAKLRIMQNDWWKGLPRGHNGMLTWVTCAPSTRH